MNYPSILKPVIMGMSLIVKTASTWVRLMSVTWVLAWVEKAYCIGRNERKPSIILSL
jgi:hypothetical protein